MMRPHNHSPKLFLLMETLFLFSSVLQSVRLESVQEYYVVSNTTDCPVDTVPCQDLSTLTQYNYLQGDFSNSVFRLVPGIHALDKIWVIKNVVNFTLEGIGQLEFDETKNAVQSNVVLICEKNMVCTPKIVIRSSQNVVINGITFVNCCINIQTTHALTVVDSSVELGGMVLMNCIDTNISHSSFTNSNRTGLDMTFDGSSSTQGTQAFTTIHRTNFTSLRRGLEIRTHTGSVTYSANELELSGIIARDNRFYNLYLVMDCIGAVHITQLESIGSGHGLYILNEQPCEAGKSMLNISNSLFEGANRLGVYIQVNQMGYVTLDSVTVQDVASIISGAKGVVLWQKRDTSSSSSPQIKTDTVFTLSNVTVQRLRQMEQQNREQYGGAAVEIRSVQDFTLSDLTLRDNIGGGLKLLNSHISVTGMFMFYNNTAFTGGAIFLQFNSRLSALATLHMDFDSNFAKLYGGGVYISPILENVDFTSNIGQDCFIGSENGFENVTLSFNNNTATLAGSAVYGNLEDCHSMEGFDSVFQFEGSESISQALDCGHSVISSNLYDVYICEQGCITGKELSLEAVPGLPFTFELTVVGKPYNGTSPALVKLVSSDFGLETVFNVDSGCTEQAMIFNPTVPTGLVNYTIVVSDMSRIYFFDTQTTIEINILPCPHGFHLPEGDSSCNCHNALTAIGVSCDLLTGTLVKPSNTWVDPVRECLHVAKVCPFDYCTELSSGGGTNFSSEDPNAQCAHNRSGLLCGNCTDGFSLILGSNRCQNCTTSEAAWRVPIIVLGSALAGIALIIMLVELNITVSVGTFNGLIFFANVVKIYDQPFYSTSSNLLIYTLGWLNLDLSIETCFTNGLGACGKIGLQFVFPLFLIISVIIIILLSSAGQWRIVQLFRLSRIISPVSMKVTALMGTHTIPVLATLFLLSYNKFLTTIVLILYRAKVFSCCDAQLNLTECNYTSLWYMDGNIPYFEGCHWVLFSLALVVLIFLFLFTAFLLLFPFAERVLLRFVWYRKYHILLKPWYDAYGGPYKDRYRSWTGVLLLVRCTLAPFVSFGSTDTTSLTALAWICLFLISFVATCQVYKYLILNVMEVWFLLSLFMLAFLAESSSELSQEIGTYFITSFCNLICVCVILYHVHVRLSVYKWYHVGTCTKFTNILLKLHNKDTSKIPKADSEQIDFDDQFRRTYTETSDSRTTVTQTTITLSDEDNKDYDPESKETIV